MPFVPGEEPTPSPGVVDEGDIGFELAMQRKQTLAFVAAKPMSIVLNRTTWIDNGSGGYRRGPTLPLPPQTVRLTESGNQVQIRRTVDGLEISPEYVMIARWDVDVQRGDTFNWNNVKYEVVFVQLDRSYETKAEVGYRG